MNIAGALPAAVGEVIRQLNIRFAAARPHADDSGAAIVTKVRARQFAYESMLEMAMNFFGMESRWLDAEEKHHAIRSIRNALAEWEAREAAESQTSVAAAVARHFLDRMKLVQKGASMVARTAVRIEQALDFGEALLLVFLDKAQAEIDGGIIPNPVLVWKGNQEDSRDEGLAHTGDFVDSVIKAHVSPHRVRPSAPRVVEAYPRKHASPPDCVDSLSPEEFKSFLFENMAWYRAKTWSRESIISL